MPLVALATATAVLVPTELMLRMRYADQPVDRCLDEASSPPHGKAGCTSYVKAAEGPWVENRYNECGYRSAASCGLLPAWSRRVAVIGSSMGAGTFVPEPEAIPARLAADLGAACGQPVQSQTLAIPDFPIGKIAASAEEAMTLDPTAIVVTITSYDLANTPGTGSAQAKPLIKSITDKVQATLKGFSTVYMAKEVFLSNEKAYLGFIAAQDRSDDQLASETKKGVAILAAQIDRMLEADRDRHIPIVLTFMPDREEIGRVRLHPGHQDPAPAALRRIAAERGIPYVDGLSSLPENVPTAALYYVANGHMNGIGDGYIARGLATGLIRSVPTFEGCNLDRATQLGMTGHLDENDQTAPARRPIVARYPYQSQGSDRGVAAPLRHH